MADFMELDWLVIGMNRPFSPRELAIAAALPLAVAILLALSGCNSSTQAAAAPLPETPAVSAVPPVSAAPQQLALDPRSYTTTGPLVAEQQADVAAERDGRIVSVAVQIGDHVR